MSDPFERLRASGPGPGPDVDAIKARARHIERTRYQRLGGVAVATILLAVVGITLTTTGPDDSARRLSVGEIETPPAETPERRPASPEAGQELSAGAAQGFVGTTASPGVGTAGTTTSSGGMAAAAPSRESAASSRAADEAPSAFRVTLEVTEIGVGQGAHFTLDVCNTTDQSHKLTFPTGQRYDFEVRRDGNLVWRWSDGKAFTQVYGEETWRPGECKTYDDAWNGRESDGGIAPPGRYSATGIVASSPQLRSAPKSFCLDAC